MGHIVSRVDINHGIFTARVAVALITSQLEELTAIWHNPPPLKNPPDFATLGRTGKNYIHCLREVLGEKSPEH